MDRKEWMGRWLKEYNQIGEHLFVEQGKSDSGSSKEEDSVIFMIVYRLLGEKGILYSGFECMRLRITMYGETLFTDAKKKKNMCDACPKMEPSPCSIPQQSWRSPLEEARGSA